MTRSIHNSRKKQQGGKHDETEEICSQHGARARADGSADCHCFRGRRYYLLDMTKEDKIGVDTKEHSETVKLSSDTKEMEQILQRLDAQKEVTTEDGHAGVLTLDHTSVKVTADYSGKVTKTGCDTVVYTAIFDSMPLEAEQPVEETDHRLPIVLGGAALLGAILGGAATRIKKKKRKGDES